MPEQPTPRFMADETHTSPEAAVPSPSVEEARERLLTYVEMVGEADTAPFIDALVAAVRREEQQRAEFTSDERGAITARALSAEATLATVMTALDRLIPVADRAESAEAALASALARAADAEYAVDVSTDAVRIALTRAEQAEANVEAMRNDSSKNKAYREVAEMASALAHLYQSWVLIDPQEPDWPVLYAALPSGQVSWHFSPDDLDLIADIPRGGEPWDGHTREQRSERLAALRPSEAEARVQGLRAVLSEIIVETNVALPRGDTAGSVTLAEVANRIARAALAAAPVPAPRAAILNPLPPSDEAGYVHQGSRETRRRESDGELQIRSIVTGEWVPYFFLTEAAPAPRAHEENT